MLGVAASPDGSRIYVVGDFTTANGQARRRVAAYSTATGQLITCVQPGGRELAGPGRRRHQRHGLRRRRVPGRHRLAPPAGTWPPSAPRTARCSTGTPTPTTRCGRSPAPPTARRSSPAARSRTSAASPPTAWPRSTPPPAPWTRRGTRSCATPAPDAGITQPQGPERLRLRHDVALRPRRQPRGHVQGAGRRHRRRRVGHRLPRRQLLELPAERRRLRRQPRPLLRQHGRRPPAVLAWRFQNAQAWTDTAGGEILNEVHGYPNWHGVEPGPSMVNWLPVFTPGHLHRPGPGGLGRDRQQRLRRLRRRVPAGQRRRPAGSGPLRPPVDLAPEPQGPRFTNNQIVPTLVPTSPTSVRVSWQAGFDRDDLVVDLPGVPRTTPLRATRRRPTRTGGPCRRSASSTPASRRGRRTATGSSSATPTTTSSTAPRVNVTMPASVPTNAYANQVRADGARLYWPLNEPVRPTTGADRQRRATGAGVSDGRSDNGVTWGHAGAIPGDTAARLTTDERVEPDLPASAPRPRPTRSRPRCGSRPTTTTRRPDPRLRRPADRQLRPPRPAHLHEQRRPADLRRPGPGQLAAHRHQRRRPTTTTSGTRSRRRWARPGCACTSTASASASRTDTTAGRGLPRLLAGRWRQPRRLAERPEQRQLRNGDVDEVAIYPTALTQAQIQSPSTRHGAGRPPPPTNQPPTAVVHCDDERVVGDRQRVGVRRIRTASIAGYSWNWGDGTPAGSRASTASHPYAAAGTYTVTLTVTDNQGATDTETTPVTVTAPPGNQPPIAAFTSTTTGLTVNVDGSGSSDPDGSIASYSWNWGDGTPAGVGCDGVAPLRRGGHLHGDADGDRQPGGRPTPRAPR